MDHRSWYRKRRQNRSPIAAAHHRSPTHSHPPVHPRSPKAPVQGLLSGIKRDQLRSEVTERHTHPRYPHSTSSRSSLSTSTSSLSHTRSPCPSRPQRYPYHRGTALSPSIPCPGRSMIEHRSGSWCCIDWRGIDIFSRARERRGG